MITTIQTTPQVWRFHHDYPDGTEQEFSSILDLLDGEHYEKVESALKLLLMACPDHIDAFHHLAMLYSCTGRPLESYLASREAVRIGLNALPQDFSWHAGKLGWDYLDNRPFLRAYHYLGIHILKDHGALGAIEVFARLVSVSPNDNLGARYVLMQCYLSTGNWLAAISTACQYPDDVGPDIIYSKAVAQLHMHDEGGAIQSLHFALKEKPNVAAELLRARHIRPKSADFGRITCGGEDEAFDYWERNRSSWSRSSEAFKLLKRVAQR